MSSMPLLFPFFCRRVDHYNFYKEVSFPLLHWIYVLWHICRQLENQQLILEIRLAETGPHSSLYFSPTTLFSYNHLWDDLNIKFLRIALVTLRQSWADELPANFSTKIFFAFCLMISVVVFYLSDVCCVAFTKFR